MLRSKRSLQLRVLFSVGLLCFWAAAASWLLSCSGCDWCGNTDAWSAILAVVRAIIN
jgi:hypothetical protein